MISLRQFDSALASTTSGPQLRELTASTVLQFAAHPSDSLPASIASFAHPIHLGSDPSEVEQDEIINNGAEGRNIDVDEPGQSQRACPRSPTIENQPAEFADCP